MNKREYLRELENALEGNLTEADIREISSDYADLFDHGIAEGKSEESVAAELGSPAKIARTILAGGRNGAGKREYTDFQKNINSKTSSILDKLIEPNRTVELSELASMSRRLGAYVIDIIALGILLLLLLIPILSVNSGSSFSMHESPLKMISCLVPILILVGSDVFTAFFLWITNGYTPGKWLLRMKVVKNNGNKLSFLDALLRDIVIKGVLNAMISGVLNIISFIWGCVTEDHKTVQDLVAKTRVIDVRKGNEQGSEKGSMPEF